MSHPPTPSRAQSPHVCAPSLPANARHGPIVYKGCHYRFSIMPLIVGRECSLCARWLLVGWVCRTPAPLRRANVAGARPSPLPPRPPPPKRARLGRAGSGLWAGLFYAGGPPSSLRSAPLPPHPPPPVFVSAAVYVCPSVVYSVVRWRFPWALGVLPPSALAPGCRTAPDVPRLPSPFQPSPRFRPTLNCVGMRFCHVNLTKR